MKISNFILQLYTAPQTVFTINEIAMITEETNRDNLKSKISYHVRKGNLLNPRKGIYTKLDYSLYELAEKIYKYSYISLETVLANEGIIFQRYKTIFVVSYLTRQIEVDENIIQYRKIKEAIRFDLKGVYQKDNYYIATKERAFLDSLYLYGDYYVDNFNALSKERLFDMIEIYNSKAMNERLEGIINNA